MATILSPTLSFTITAQNWAARSAHRSHRLTKGRSCLAPSPGLKAR